MISCWLFLGNDEIIKLFVYQITNMLIVNWKQKQGRCYSKMLEFLCRVKCDQSVPPYWIGQVWMKTYRILYISLILKPQTLDWFPIPWSILDTDLLNCEATEFYIYSRYLYFLLSLLTLFEQQHTKAVQSSVFPTVDCCYRWKNNNKTAVISLPSNGNALNNLAKMQKWNLIIIKL